MALVLAALGLGLVRPPAPYARQRAEVVEHPGAAAAQHLDALLGHRAPRRRPSSEPWRPSRWRSSTVIVALSTAPTSGGAGSAAAMTRIGVPHSQLAKSIMWHASPRMRPPPTRGSLSQWSRGQRRVDAVDERGAGRRRARTRRRRRWASWAKGRLKPIARRGVLASGGPDVVDLLAGQAEGLLDEDRLARAQRRGGDLGVAVMARADDDEVDVAALDAPRASRSPSPRPRSERATSVAVVPRRATTVTMRAPSSALQRQADARRARSCPGRRCRRRGRRRRRPGAEVDAHDLRGRSPGRARGVGEHGGERRRSPLSAP